MTEIPGESPKQSTLEIIRTHGFEFPWRPMPLVVSLTLGLVVVVMIGLGILNFMRDGAFPLVFLLLAVGCTAFALFDLFPAWPNIRVTDTSLQLWRHGKLREEIAWIELVSNARSYRLKGSVQSVDGSRRIWLYTRSSGDVVLEQLYQLTDWVSDHRDDMHRAGGSLTRAISHMLSSTGITFRPNRPDENIELGPSAVIGASTALLLLLFPTESLWFWAVLVGSLVGVSTTAWTMLSYWWRRHEFLRMGALGITHLRNGGAKVSLMWGELKTPEVRIHWLKSRPNPSLGRFQVFDASGERLINVGGYIRHVMVLDLIFEDIMLKAAFD